MRLALYLLIATPTLVQCFNFLIYNPIFGHSHVNFLANIGDILADAGHNVTMLMPVLNRPLANKTETRNKLDVIKVDLSDDAYNRMLSIFSSLTTNTWEEDDLLGMLRLAGTMYPLYGLMCEETILRYDILKELKSKNFDAGISEPLSVCGYGIFDILDIPAYIAATSTPPLDTVSGIIGQPMAPSYVPASMSTSSDRMSIWERVLNVFYSQLFIRSYGSILVEEQMVLSKHFPQQIRSVEEMIAGASIQLINTNPLIDFPFPTLQKNVAIGGMQVDLDGNDKKQLERKWDEILNLRTKNVLISFGSVAKSSEMPEKYKASLLSVFAAMEDTTFIWKYEDLDSDIAANLNNVHKATWIPQTALLADPRLSLFITHGGLGSTTELAHLGKPAIMIPLFGDQTRNSLMLSRHGGVKVMKKFELSSPNVIQQAIEEVIRNPSYLSNSTRLSNMLRDQPFTAKQLVLRHCEFVAKYGRLPEMDPHGRHLSFFQYFFIDITLILLSLIVASKLVLKHIIKLVCIEKVKLE